MRRAARILAHAAAVALLAAMPAAAAQLAPQAAGEASVPPAEPADPADPAAPAPAPALVPATRSGQEIYRRFREGLADPRCEPGSSSARWRRHFAAAPLRLADGGDDTLALFGYVVDAVIEAGLPTEYALIPFVESGYKPAARSPLGPAGLWQMIRLTARAHHVPMRPGYDGRLSPVASTRAAVRYLKTLHGMFAGDWRLAVMAYNTGEYRVFGALRRSGQVARSADPEKLTSLPGITRAYVRKLHALSCLFDQVDDAEPWQAAMDRPVPVLEAVDLPAGVRDLGTWAAANGRDPARVRRLNPAFPAGRLTPGQRERRVLAGAMAAPLLATESAPAPAPAPGAAGSDAAAQAH